MSFYRYQCRSRQPRCGGSGTWRAPLSLQPLARFVTGGAGARPDHSISGPRPYSRVYGLSHNWRSLSRGNVAGINCASERKGSVMRVFRDIVAVSLATVGLAQAAAAQGMEQLYEAAKKEGALVLYGGGPITLYEPWAHEFEQRFPGIKVTAKAGSSNVLDQEIDTQMKAGNLQVDMAVLQTIQDYERWKKAGVLLPFKPEGFDKIDDEWKDKDGAYVGVTVNGLV